MTPARTSTEDAKAAPEAQPFRVEVPDPDERTVYERMAAVQQEVDRIPKRGRNERFNYDFVTESDVTDAIRASCGRHGLAIIPRMIGRTEHPLEGAQREDGRTSTGVAVTLDFTFTIGCATGELEVPWQGDAWDYPGEKALPKAVTMAKKTFLVATFLLSTGDDAEASSSGDEGSRASSGSGRGAGAAQGRKLSAAQIGMLLAKGKAAGMTANDVRSLIAWKCERDFPLGMDDVAQAPGGKAFVDGIIRDIGLYPTDPAACLAALEAYRDRVLRRLDEKRQREAAEAAQAVSGEEASQTPPPATSSDTSNANAEGPPSQDAPAAPASDADEALFDADPTKTSDPEPPAWSTPAAKECSCGVGDDETDPAKHANGCDLSIPF